MGNSCSCMNYFSSNINGEQAQEVNPLSEGKKNNI